MSEIVMPNDTNNLGNLFGGRLLQWMDTCAAISSQRHSGRVCVTASVDTVDFNSPIQQGEIIILESVVNRAFRTSMEIEINVWAESPRDGTRRKCNRAFYTFVAIDEDGRPQPVPKTIAETPEEQANYDGAARRRDFRLLLAGRIHPDDQAIKDHLRRIADESPS
jgi:acyl-CoA hydrolase